MDSEASSRSSSSLNLSSWRRSRDSYGTSSASSSTTSTSSSRSSTCSTSSSSSSSSRRRKQTLSGKISLSCQQFSLCIARGFLVVCLVVLVLLLAADKWKVFFPVACSSTSTAPSSTQQLEEGAFRVGPPDDDTATKNNFIQGVFFSRLRRLTGVSREGPASSSGRGEEVPMTRGRSADDEDPSPRRKAPRAKKNGRLREFKKKMPPREAML